MFSSDSVGVKFTNAVDLNGTRTLRGIEEDVGGSDMMMMRIEKKLHMGERAGANAALR